MKKLLLLAFQLGFLLPQLSGQSTASYLKSAEEAFAAKDYATAYIHAKEVLKRDSSANLDLLKMAMMASVEVCEFDQAEQYMRTISSVAPDDNDPILIFYRAKIRHRKGIYDDANHYYNEFISSSGSNNPELVALAKQKAAECNQLLGPKSDLADRKSNPSTSDPTMLEDVSTPGHSDFAMPIFKDNIIVGKHTPPEQCECEKPCSDKIYLLEKTTASNATKLALPKSFKKVGHITYANDGQRVYFTSCKCKDDSYTCEIYYADRDGSSTGWSSPVKLPAHINHGKNYTSTQPFYLEGRGTGNDTLFYVSDFHGGQGGRGDLDIYYSVVVGDDHKPSVSMSEINTTGDEITPYFHKTTNTFFFSSNGYMTLGGYDFDIFRYIPPQYDAVDCTDESTVSGYNREVHNMGRPINSEFDDLFFSKEEDSERMIFSSNRKEQKAAELEHCCPDVFEATYSPKVDIIVSVFCQGGENCRVGYDGPEPIGQGVADLLSWEGDYNLPTPDRPGDDNVFIFRNIPLEKKFKMTATLGPESGYTPASEDINTGECDGETIRLNLVLVPDLYFSVNFIDQCEESKAVDVRNFVLRDDNTGQAVPPIDQSGTSAFKYQLCPNTTYSYTTDGCSASDANYRFPESFSKTFTTTCAPLNSQETIPLIPPQQFEVRFQEACDPDTPVAVNNIVLRDSDTGAEIIPISVTDLHTYTYEIYADQNYELDATNGSPVDQDYIFNPSSQLSEKIGAACTDNNRTIELYKPIPQVDKINLPLYFDHDQPRADYDVTRDYASYFEGYLSGVDFDRTVRPYRSDRAYLARRNQLRLEDADLAGNPENDSRRIRYQDYLNAANQYGANCNGDDVEQDVKSLFDTIRTNYNIFQQSIVNQVYSRYIRGETIEITVIGAASGSGESNYNVLLSERRVQTIIEEFRTYVERQEGPEAEFDQSRFKVSIVKRGASAYEEENKDYPTKGVCRIYDVRAAKDRNIIISEIKYTLIGPPCQRDDSYGSLDNSNNN